MCSVFSGGLCSHTHSDRTHMWRVARPAGCVVQLWQQLSASALFCSCRSCRPIHHLNSHVLFCRANTGRHPYLQIQRDSTITVGDLHSVSSVFFCECSDLERGMKMPFSVREMLHITSRCGRLFPWDFHLNTSALALSHSFPIKTPPVTSPIGVWPKTKILCTVLCRF